MNRLDNIYLIVATAIIVGGFFLMVVGFGMFFIYQYTAIAQNNETYSYHVQSTGVVQETARASYFQGGVNPMELEWPSENAVFVGVQ